VVKAVLMVVARVFIAAVAPKAINAATRAYSIRSCPDSSLRTLDRICLKFFIVFSFKVVKEKNLRTNGMLYLLSGDVNAIFSRAQREILTLVMGMYANDRARKDNLIIRDNLALRHQRITMLMVERLVPIKKCAVWKGKAVITATAIRHY
jgi:hypothetical protein